MCSVALSKETQLMAIQEKIPPEKHSALFPEVAVLRGTSCHVHVWPSVVLLRLELDGISIKC